MFASRLLRLRPLAATSVAATAATLAFTSRKADNAGFFSSAPKVDIKYFAVQGAAETFRYVMVLGGCEWTESGWPLDFKKFSGPASLKLPDGPCPLFAAAVADGTLDCNLGRAPIVTIDGKETFGQSKTIERYLARRLGLMGSDEFAAAQIDAITEHVRDLKDKYNKAKGVDKEKKDASVKAFFTTEMPEFCAKIEKALPPSAGGPALVGKSLSYADVTLYVFVVDYFSDKAAALAAISSCPRLKASVEAVGKHPRVVKYRAERTNIAT